MFKTIPFLALCGALTTLGAFAAPSAHAGECSNAELTKAIREATGREPKGEAATGECDPMRYPLALAEGEAPTYEMLVAKVKEVASAPARTRGATRGSIATLRIACKDPWVEQVIRELTGRSPVGESNSGECNIYRYGGGSWSRYDDLRNKVRESLFNQPEIKAKEPCFGSQGSKCDALSPLAVGPFAVGRTNLPDGRYNIWTSVGSINHDNCCLNNPRGKWCSGNEWNHNNTCVKEWDKAFWNAAEGKAWTETFDPRVQPNLALVTNPRSSRSRDGGSLTRFETVETRRLAAPRGQKLDVGDEAFCRSGSATTYEEKTFWGAPTGKRWIVCN